MNIDRDILDRLRGANNIALFCHIRPDADAIGSMCAMYLALISLGKNVDMYCDSPIPEKFHKMVPSSKKILKDSKGKKYDLACSLDCATLNRLGYASAIFKSADITARIDHHPTEEPYAKYEDVHLISSTCELVYDYIKELNKDISPDIATSIYLGIAGDTGCLIYGSITPDTYRIVGELASFGADIECVNYWMFRYRTRGQFDLFRKCLSRFDTYLGGKLAIAYVTQGDFEKFNVDNSDTAGFVNTITAIEGTDVSCMMSEEKPNYYVISFRSATGVDVSKLAATFGGGGHPASSGARLYGGANTVRSKIIEACKRVYGWSD